MSNPDATRPPRPGLRERKKAKTRAVIQQHALRLIHDQGYEATTIEQIAEAAEVSPSTFFRYFPNKEDVVLYDEVDPVLIAALRRQPGALSPVQAIRAAFKAVYDAMPANERAGQEERARLIFSVPDLRMRTLDQVIEGARVFSDIVASRMGRRPDEDAVKVVLGAVLGVSLAMILPPGKPGLADIFSRIDRGLALLEAWLPRSPPAGADAAGPSVR